uniref:Internal scaffolding protein n=1 Tax=Dulem virus 170 TaxID=3145647 RepID=A0AAU8B8J5_9VIRU
MKFKTQYDSHDRVNCCSGNAVKPTYEGFYDKDGVLKLKQTGQINIYDEIQSHAESVDIYTTLKKFTAGDTGALSKVQGLYGDFTEMPKTYADMLNVVINGEKKFNELPVDVRAKFNHNFGEFVAGIGSDSWREKLTVPSPAPSPAVVTPDVAKGDVVSE